MDYMLYQMPMKKTPQEDVMDALRYYIEKYGQPPGILLETSLENLELPEDMNVVTKSIRIPKNMLLIGSVEDE